VKLLMHITSSTRGNVFQRAEGKTVSEQNITKHFLNLIAPKFLNECNFNI
jgi:hypothetical protein